MAVRASWAHAEAMWPLAAVQTWVGHRKIWAMVRHDGHVVSEATVLRILRDEGLILPAEYQRERRQLAARRKAAFAVEPNGPNQVWQLDFSEFETTTGGTWRLAGCRDYWSKYEHPFHLSPTGNQHDAIDAIELALADYQAMFGHPLIEACPVDPETGEVLPVVTIVTDNGGPFRSFGFESFIAAHPELRHVRTRVKTPGQNGSRERGFGTLKYERLYLDEIDDALMLAERAEDYRIEYNELRPHEAISWNRPKEVHRGLADPTSQHFKPTKSCQLLDAGHKDLNAEICAFINGWNDRCRPFVWTKTADEILKKKPTVNQLQTRTTSQVFVSSFRLA